MREDIRREYRRAKGVHAALPVACVHQVGYIDNWRHPQNLTQQQVSQGLVELQQEAGEFCSKTG